MLFLPLILLCLMWPEVKGDKNSQGTVERTCSRKNSLQEPSRILNNTKDRLVYPVMAEWVSDQSFDNIVLYPNEKVELPPTSKVVWSLADEDMTSGQCAEECMKEEWCSSFFVDFSKNLCLLHEVVFFTPDTGGRKVSAPGARYFRQVDSRCNLSKGLYRWREEDLCFKLLPPGTIKQGPSEDADAYCRDKLGGSLIKLSTIRRTEWIRKILLQWHSSSSSRSVAIDFVKGKIPAQIWCPAKLSVVIAPRSIPVLHEECDFKLEYKGYEKGFYFLCEIF